MAMSFVSLRGSAKVMHDAVIMNALVLVIY